MGSRIGSRIVEVLGEIGDDRAEGTIEEALKDEEIWVRTKAKIAKEQMFLLKESRLKDKGKRLSRKKMRENKDAIKLKIAKLREMLNSDKILDVKIWAANEMLDMGEEGLLSANEMIKNNEVGAYVVGKEMRNRK